MVKGTKTLNPADKARKEARKKELKKNKKQRLQVRSAAIESRDPEQVISDLEKLDRFEFDVSTNPSMNDSLYKDKRKRLRETWTKILTYYQKEDPERHKQLKKIEAEYEARHKKLVREFEAIKAAQDVKLEDVFLPPETSALDLALAEIKDDDPLLSLYVAPTTEGVKPPGCPPGLPPDFKQLVVSLQKPLSAQVPLLSHTPVLPAITQSVSKINIKLSKTNQKNAASFVETTGEQQKKPAPASAPPKPATGPIIESKPVLFKTTTTRFLPSSLRSKLKDSTSKATKL